MGLVLKWKRQKKNVSMTTHGLKALVCLSCLLAACSQNRPEGAVCQGTCPSDPGPTSLVSRAVDQEDGGDGQRSVTDLMANDDLRTGLRDLMLKKAETVPLVAPERALSDLPRLDDGRLHVLALSSGGPFGAFGAGFLNGWSEQTDADRRRPERFDIVTGVSAGALLATFAFLGQERDVDLERQYTSISTEDVFRERSLFRVLFSNAFFDTAPLRETLEEVVTTSLLDEVAAATDVDPDDGRPGRFLLVLATNLDSGLPRIFDLGAIARDKTAPDRIDRYIDALMASAAIPVAFPPVLIDGDMHVDGGARLALFFNRLMEEQRSSIEARTVPAPRLDIIVNSEVTVEQSCTENTLVGIGRRSIDVVLNQITLDSLYRTISEAERDGAEVRYATAEGSNCVSPADPKNIFERSFLQCLFAEGKTLGSSETPWLKGLDDFPGDLIAPDNSALPSCVFG
jgi:predicted acylesterase/phospholipase RssA